MFQCDISHRIVWRVVRRSVRRLLKVLVNLQNEMGIQVLIRQSQLMFIAKVEIDAPNVEARYRKSFANNAGAVFQVARFAMSFDNC